MWPPLKLLPPRPVTLIATFPWETMELLSPNVFMRVALVGTVEAMIAGMFYSGGPLTAVLPLHRLEKNLLLKHRLPELPARCSVRQLVGPTMTLLVAKLEPALMLATVWNRVLVVPALFPVSPRERTLLWPSMFPTPPFALSLPSSVPLPARLRTQTLWPPTEAVS